MVGGDKRAELLVEYALRQLAYASANLGMIAASANRDIAQYGEWQCNWEEAAAQIYKEREKWGALIERKLGVETEEEQ